MLTRSPNRAELAALLPPLRAIIDFIEGSVEWDEENDLNRSGELSPRMIAHRQELRDNSIHS